MRPQILDYRTRVWGSAPQAVQIARGLGWLFGKAIKGDNGAIRIGYPAIASRQKFAGYAQPPQIFTGYTAAKVAGGTVRVAPAAMPSVQAPIGMGANPLVSAMATVSAGQMGG